MTREDKLKVLEMRLDGYSVVEIADNLGFTRQHINNTLNMIVKSQGCNQLAKCIYPGLRNWMLDNNFSAYKVNSDLKIAKNTTCFYKRLVGETKFSIDEIKALIKYTGLSFEELFGGESE